MRSAHHPESVLHHLNVLIGARGKLDPTDRQLLEFFAGSRDQAAFAALVRRHGRMVLSVCRRVLGHEEDAEDAFQATFLVLAHKAGAVRWQESVGPWLHETAFRIARRARASHARRRAHEKEAGMPKTDATEKASWRDFCAIVDEELQRLPQKCRAAVVQCYLEGQAQAEAAAQLGCSEATLNRRLAEGRERLRARLDRRGITVSCGLLAVALSRDTAEAAVPATLVSATTRAAMLAAAGKAGGASAKVLALTEAALQSMTGMKVKLATALLLAVGLLATSGLATFQVLATPAKPAGDGTAAAAPVNQLADTTPAPDDPLPAGALARLGTTRFRQTGPITAVAYSPDGTILATAAKDGIGLWDVASGKEIRRLRCKQADLLALALAFSPDGKTLVSGGCDRLLHWWDVSTGDELRQVEHPALVAAVAFAPDGRTVASSAAGRIRLWDAATGKALNAFGTETAVQPMRITFTFGSDEEPRFRTTLTAQTCDWSRITAALAFSPDGKMLASTGGGKGIHLWDPATGEALRQLQGEALRGVRSLAFSPDGKRLASPGAQYTVRLWDVDSGEEIRQLEAHTDVVLAVAFSPDGQTVASSDDAGAVCLWDADASRLLRRVAGPCESVLSLAFSRDGQRLATGECTDLSSMGVVRLWDVDSGREHNAAAAHHAAVNTAAYSADGKTIATAGQDGAVRLWDAATGRAGDVYSGHGGGVKGVALFPDGRRLAAVDEEGMARVWDLAAREEIRKFKAAARGPVKSAAFSGDGNLLAVVTAGGEALLLEVAGGRLLHSFKGRKERIAALALSADGRLLATADTDRTVRLWETATGKLVSGTLADGWEETDFVIALAFSLDGRFLATGGPQSFRVRDLTTGAVVQSGAMKVAPDKAIAQGLSFSPDRRVLAVVHGSAVHLRDLATGKDLPPLTGHLEQVSAVAFSRDGAALVSVGADTTGLVWSAGALPR